MHFSIDTAEKARRNWPDFSAEDIVQLEAEGLITSIVEATNNQHVLGRHYEGAAAIRRVWVWGDTTSQDVVGVHSDWVRIDAISPAVVARTIGYGLQLEPRLVEALKQTNEGILPTILPPLS